jgi:hypothetical protein
MVGRRAIRHSFAELAIQHDRVTHRALQLPSLMLQVERNSDMAN